MEQSRTSRARTQTAGATPTSHDSQNVEYPGVPAWLIGWAAFTLDFAVPIAAAFFGLAASAAAIATGGLGPAALAGASALGGAAGLWARRWRDRPPVERATPPG